MIVDGNKIRPEDGLVLTKDGIYSDCVFLGINDSPENWREVQIPEEQEAEQADETDYVSALNRLGVRLE